MQQHTGRHDFSIDDNRQPLFFCFDEYVSKTGSKAKRLDREMSPSIKLPETRHVLLSLPARHVLMVQINRPAQMNALTIDACWEMDMVWAYLDDEPELSVGVLTGVGDRALSAGMDLKERARLQQATGAQPHLIRRHHVYPPTGFGGMTRRVGRKPIVAAVNGLAQGGGFELVLNADLVLAAKHATFSLPDVKVGTAAIQGALPRLVKTVGMQRASLVALAAHELSADEAERWGIVNGLVNDDERFSSQMTGVVGAAVDLASRIASMSPDSVIVSRSGLREAWENSSVERAVQNIEQTWAGKLMGGVNAMEGMAAFAEKRSPRWKPSRL